MIASWTRVVAVKMETSGLFKVKMTGSSIGLQPKMEQLCTVSKNKTGSNHKLLIAKFRLKLKKVGETSRPFRNDLNQMPYDYTVRNRFKRLDLIDRVPDELWTEVYDIVQETGIKTIPMEKKCKKAKRLSEEALQITEKKRSEKQRRKGKYKHFNAEFQRIARRDKKAFLSDQCKEIEENNRMGKTRPWGWISPGGHMNQALLPPGT